MLKNFMYFTILTFAVVVVWIGLSIYRNFNPVETTTTTTVIPIDGTFDFQTVARLKSRKAIPVDFNEASIASQSAVQSLPTPESTPSAAFITLPISTTSGNFASPSSQL